MSIIGSVFLGLFVGAFFAQVLSSLISFVIYFFNSIKLNLFKKYSLNIFVLFIQSLVFFGLILLINFVNNKWLSFGYEKIDFILMWVSIVFCFVLKIPEIVLKVKLVYRDFYIINLAKWVSDKYFLLKENTDTIKTLMGKIVQSRYPLVGQIKKINFLNERIENIDNLTDLTASFLQAEGILSNENMKMSEILEKTSFIMSELQKNNIPDVLLQGEIINPVSPESIDLTSKLLKFNEDLE